jgi:NCAIR mutase (PurE)-related protein
MTFEIDKIKKLNKKNKGAISHKEILIFAKMVIKEEVNTNEINQILNENNITLPTQITNKCVDYIISHFSNILINSQMNFQKNFIEDRYKYKNNIDGLLLCSKCENQLKIEDYPEGFFIVLPCVHCIKDS